MLAVSSVSDFVVVAEMNTKQFYEKDVHFVVLCTKMCSFSCMCEIGLNARLTYYYDNS